jgi:hypothetical protein
MIFFCQNTHEENMILAVLHLSVEFDYKKEAGKKSKAIAVTGRGGPYGCETSRLPQYLENRLTDSGEVVIITRRPSFNPRKIPDTHFC